METPPLKKYPSKAGNKKIKMLNMIFEMIKYSNKKKKKKKKSM